MTISSTVPYEDNANQQNLEKQVSTWNQDNQALQENNLDISHIIGQINDMEQQGNMDGAMMLAILSLFPALIDHTSDEQKMFADNEEIGAALDLFGTSSEGEFEKGSTYDPSKTTDQSNSTGMQDADAEQFKEDQADLYWDLTTPDANGGMLDMLDSNTKAQLTDVTKNIMAQYKQTPETWNSASDKDIAGATNGFWESQGQDGSPQDNQISDILGQFQTATNTCDAQEQTANSFLQTWQQYENSYIGSEQGIEQSQTQLTAAYVAGTKPV